MAEATLHDRHILVCEDEYFVASELASELARLGANVIGPASTLKNGRTLLRESPDIDGAVLDFNLRGENVLPLADELVERNVPFLFITGYDASVIPSRFGHVVRCVKPVAMNALVTAVSKILQKSG